MVIVRDTIRDKKHPSSTAARHRAAKPPANPLYGFVLGVFALGVFCLQVQAETPPNLEPALYSQGSAASMANSENAGTGSRGARDGVPRDEAPRTTAPAAPHFLIESIAVVNAERTPKEIIISETRLKMGESYSEAELRDAVFRVVRLPFLLDAEFSLRKGTVRDSYELVISVIETRLWFFGQDYNGFFSKDFRDSLDYNDSASLLIGRRFFLGRRGVLSASTDTGRGVLQADYTHYDLFDRNALLTVRVSSSVCNGFNRSGTAICLAGVVDTFSERAGNGSEDGSTEDRLVTTDFWSFDSGLAIPLRGNHSLQFTASNSYSKNEIGSSGRKRDDWFVGTSWALNSLDDPVFPTEGKFVITTIGFGEVKSTNQSSLLRELEPLTITKSKGRLVSLSSSARKFWPTSRRTSFSAELNGRFSHRQEERITDQQDRFSISRNTYGANLLFGHSHFLVRSALGKPFNELRWENSAGLGWSDSSDFGTISPSANLNYSLGTSLRYRTTWGVFSLTFSYADNSEL